MPPADANPELDLDAQIDRVEQRLVAREAWVRATTAALAQRAQAAATLAPWLLPAAGGAAVLWLAWRWRRRPGPAHGPMARPQTQQRALPGSAAGEVTGPGGRHIADGQANVPWAGLTTLAWLLAPAKWQQRMGPAAASTVVSTLLSVGRRLLRRRER